MTSSTSVKKNFLPPGLVSNLEDVLRSRKGPGERGEESKDVNNASPHPSSSTSDANLEVSATQKPVILVTNSEGIDSPGLTYLVEGLVREGSYNVHVCAPQS